MNRLAALSTTYLLLSSGCFLYFNDDDPCDFGGNVGVPTTDGQQAAEPGRRNPVTGQCEFFGGGPFPCDDECGPCAQSDFGDPIPPPTWAFCEDQCTGLDEQSCRGSDACRAIYNPNLGYEACWGTDLNGPVRGGDCTTFGAEECSLHDDCFAIHESPCNADQAPGLEEAPSCELAAFISCGNEGPNGPGDCYGEVNCDSLPPECPPETMPGISDGCWTGFCIPIEDCETTATCVEITEEFSCIARSDCAPTYRGIDCTCDDFGCTCADHEFESCEDALVPAG